MAKLLDRIVVVDVESTCWKGPPPAGQRSEIIEVGICTVEVQAWQREQRRSLLVRPEHSEVSPFCTELTTITPAMLAEANDLGHAVGVLRREFRASERLWASWGDYDRRQFERNCRDAGLKYPFGPGHLNVKTLFAMTVGCSHEVGMDAACQQLGIPLEGTHHRGVDDAWNIAAILISLLKPARQHWTNTIV